MATSAAKLEANRLNARKSTGPRTRRGRIASSKNAISHGLFCKQIVLPGESKPEFDLLRKCFIRDLKPQNVVELSLVDRMVKDQWLIRRFERVEAAFYDRQTALMLDEAQGKLGEALYAEDDAHLANAVATLSAPRTQALGDQFMLTELMETSSLIEKLSMLRQRAENSFARHLRLLEKLRKISTNELPDSPFDSLGVETGPLVAFMDSAAEDMPAPPADAPKADASSTHAQSAAASKTDSAKRTQPENETQDQFAEHFRYENYAFDESTKRSPLQVIGSSAEWRRRVAGALASRAMNVPESHFDDMTAQQIRQRLAEWRAERDRQARTQADVPTFQGETERTGATLLKEEPGK
jgi:hypothetical protein